ncbi:MAG: DivIVA domain-containing protein, partial [Acidimicrobiales bacterium]
MDLIRELKDVQFGLILRGYNDEEVDAFLAKVRSEVAEVISNNEVAQQRISELENQLANGETDTEGTLRRTLVLAQRLADETVADARNTATEIVDAANTEAAQTVSEARSDAESQVEQARDAVAKAEAARASVEERTAAESDQLRADAVVETDRLLAEAEMAAAARLESIESAAQAEAENMKQPVRDEVGQLENVRSQLETDIAALEQHLVDQRVRVRNAVEALRVGMSGSIDDLERVAEDDALLAPEDRPATSGAAAEDVPESAQIEIVDTVMGSAERAPTAEQLSDEVAAALEAESLAGDLAAETPHPTEHDAIEHD